MATLLAIVLIPNLAACLAVDHALFVLKGPPAPTVITIEFPAVDLPGADAGGRAAHLEPLWIESPIEGWMYGFTVTMRDASGDTVPSSVLHHLKVLKPAERELLHPIMLRVLAAGSETRGARLPRSIGVPVSEGDSLLATAMIHNDLGTNFSGVRLRVQIDVTPASASSSARTAYPFFLQVPGPEEIGEFDLPPGRSERSFQARPAVAGEVIGFGGHAHRYAVELRFEDAASGQVLWRSAIRTDDTGTILDVPRKRYVFRRGPMLLPDHIYRVSVVYDNPTGETLVGAGMGTVGGLIVPRGAWPEVDRNDPLYQLDRDRELNVRGSGAPPPHVH
ncbi:MAG: hypothetical protein WD737_13675 [Gemmatimonadota bacterium]